MRPEVPAGGVRVAQQTSQNREGELMHVTVVHVRVRPECVADFIAATESNHVESIREEGNRRFDVLQSSADPTYFILYEAYADEQASARHKETPHYAAWRDAVAEMMSEPRRGEKFQGLLPA
jgi:autoinducer 2-degrading protein